MGVQNTFIFVSFIFKWALWNTFICLWAGCSCHYGYGASTLDFSALIAIHISCTPCLQLLTFSVGLLWSALVPDRLHEEQSKLFISHPLHPGMLSTQTPLLVLFSFTYIPWCCPCTSWTVWRVRTHHYRIPICTSNLLLSIMLSCISSICPATSPRHVLVIGYSHPRCLYVCTWLCATSVKLLCPDKYVRMLLCQCIFMSSSVSKSSHPLICLSSQISSPSLPISCSLDTVPDLVRVSANL